MIQDNQCVPANPAIASRLQFTHFVVRVVACSHSCMSTTPNRRKRVAVAFAIAALVVLTASALFGRFGFSSVCSQCGVMRDTTEWQIPLTRISVFRHSSENATPVSIVLSRGGIVPTHEHQWLFCQGSGNGVGCAIGEGRHIRPSMESDGVAAVIAASQRFGDLQFRDRVLHALFDPKTSEAVLGLGMNAPTNGFSDASVFHAWLTQETPSFDEMVAMDQKR